MRFGTFHLMGSPEMAPGEQRINETIEQIVLAEELGFDYAWVAEHHFSNYGYSTNPLLTIANAAALTQRIRFGQGVLVTPLWHPIRLAEDIAQTDILTKGRLDIGLGRGYQPMEFRGFDVDIEQSQPMFREHLEVMQKVWSEDDVTFDGHYYRLPDPVTVLPRPLQKPHPPIWYASSSMSSLDWTASQGYGALVTANNIGADELAQWRDRFATKRSDAGHDPAGLRFGSLLHTYVTETDEEARSAMWQSRWQRRLAEHLRLGDQRLKAGRNDPYPTATEIGDDERWARLLYGRPERCVTRLRQLAEIGVTHVLTWFDIGGVEQENVLRSMRLFAREVRPALAEVSV